MAFSPDDVDRIAHLARIEIEPCDTEQTLAQLTGIFGLIEQMQLVSTDGVESMAHARDVTLRLRDDKVTEPNQRAAFQKGIAPQVEAGLYLVPKVIE
jgi:aspartyl-tRNA(Asn)/glutamyl-tRNA(Gln) amidotransferase subunit C